MKRKLLMATAGGTSVGSNVAEEVRYLCVQYLAAPVLPFRVSLHWRVLSVRGVRGRGQFLLHPENQRRGKGQQHTIKLSKCNSFINQTTMVINYIVNY